MCILPGILKELHEQFNSLPEQHVAQKIINEYFRSFNTTQLQEQLWELTHGTITNEILKDTQTASDRHNILFFYEYTKLFLNAVYFLHGKT